MRIFADVTTRVRVEGRRPVSVQERMAIEDELFYTPKVDDWTITTRDPGYEIIFTKGLTSGEAETILRHHAPTLCRWAEEECK